MFSYLRCGQPDGCLKLSRSQRVFRFILGGDIVPSKAGTAGCGCRKNGLRKKGRSRRSQKERAAQKRGGELSKSHSADGFTIENVPKDNTRTG